MIHFSKQFYFFNNILNSSFLDTGFFVHIFHCKNFLCWFLFNQAYLNYILVLLWFEMVFCVKIYLFIWCYYLIITFPNAPRPIALKTSKSSNETSGGISFPVSPKLLVFLVCRCPIIFVSLHILHHHLFDESPAICERRIMKRYLKFHFIITKYLCILWYCYSFWLE